MVFCGVATGQFPVLTEMAAAALTQATLAQATLIQFIWPKGEKGMKLRQGLMGKMGSTGGVMREDNVLEYEQRTLYVTL